MSSSQQQASRKRALLSALAGGPAQKKVATSGQGHASADSKAIPVLTGNSASAPSSGRLPNERLIEEHKRAALEAAGVLPRTDGHHKLGGGAPAAAVVGSGAAGPGGAPAATAVAPLTASRLAAVTGSAPTASGNTAVKPEVISMAGGPSGSKLPQREVGKVEEYDKKKGYGFVISENPPAGEAAKVFVYHTHIKTVNSFRYLTPGAEVSFLRGHDKERDGLPCCLDVRQRDGKTLIDNDEGRVARPQTSFAMQNWQNVFHKYPSMTLECYYDRAPAGVMGHDDALQNVNIQYLGALFSLLKARFGGEAVKYLKEKFVPNIEIKDPDELDIEEVFKETTETCEKEFLVRAGLKNQPDGCELCHVLFQHVTVEGRPFVHVHVANTGSCSVIACDALGRALRLNEPHLATPLTVGSGGNGFAFEAARDSTSLAHAKSGFNEGGGQPGLEYWLPAHRVFGARPFKKTGCSFDHLPETRHARTWALKSIDLAARNSSKAFPVNRPTFDYFLLITSPELIKWHGGDQAVIDEALLAMKKGRARGEPLPDSCVKTLIRGALKKGAPEDLSCMCIVPSWHSRGLDAFLEKMSEKGQQHEEVDDGLDMFAS